MWVANRFVERLACSGADGLDGCGYQRSTLSLQRKWYGVGGKRRVFARRIYGQLALSH